MEKATNLASELLSPITVDDFVGRYWEREAVHVSGGAAKAASVYSPQQLRDVIARPGRTVDAFIPDPGNRLMRNAQTAVTVTIPSERIDVLFKAGATISARGVERDDADLARLVAALRVALGFVGPIACDAWLSPETNGLPIHFDGVAVLAFQLEGSKKWRVSRTPVLPWPETVGFLFDDGEAAYQGMGERHQWENKMTKAPDVEWIDVTLKPGDLLYIPAGCWHTTASSSAHSLSMHVRFKPLGFWDLLGKVLGPELRADAAWRAVPCAAAPADLAPFLDARLAELGQSAGALRRNLAPPSPVDEHGRGASAGKATSSAHVRPSRAVCSSHVVDGGHGAPVSWRDGAHVPREQRRDRALPRRQ